MDDQQQGSFIGVADVYRMQEATREGLHELAVNVAHMSGQFEAVTQWRTVTDAEVARLREQVSGHQTILDQANPVVSHTSFDTRIRSLERWRYSIPASLLTAIAAISVAVTQLVHH